MEPVSEPLNRSSTTAGGGWRRCARAYIYLRAEEKFFMQVYAYARVSECVSVCGCVYRCLCVRVYEPPLVYVCVNLRVYATRFTISVETSDRPLHVRLISVVR